MANGYNHRKMKDSGVEWIGEIPEDWTYTKLKYHYTFEKGKNAALYTQEYIGQNIGKYPVYSGQTENQGIMGEIDSYDYEIEECLFTTTVGAKVMTPKVIGGKFSLSQNCLIMKSKNTECNQFYYYMLLSLFSYEKSMIPSYMQPSLRIEDLNRYSFYVPLGEEQRKIAVFLDEKCLHIDSVIEKTKASIEEYKKLKQAVITHAVTKGVRGERPMKDSGSVWFGKVPENWKMKKLKYQFHIKKDIAGEEGYTVLSITQKGIKPKDISKNEGQLASDYSNYQLVNPGDFAMNHMDLLTGWVDISNYSGVTSPDYRVFVLNDNEKNNSRYYLYMMQMCYSNKIFYGLGQGVSGLGRWRLQADKFLNFLIAVPTPSEQNEIAEYLDNKCTRIDMLIEKKEQFLTELENHKKSLIYEYVTGKKEVPQS